MNDHTPLPDDAELDALAEQLADALVELASQPGVLRLAALQMAGLLPESGLDDGTVAKALGCSRQTVCNNRQSALEKLALRPDVRALALSLFSR